MTKLPVRLVRLGSCRVAESEPRPKRRPAGNESTGAPISSEVQDECKMPRKSNKEAVLGAYPASSRHAPCRSHSGRMGLVMRMRCPPSSRCLFSLSRRLSALTKPSPSSSSSAGGSEAPPPLLRASAHALSGTTSSALGNQCCDVGAAGSGPSGSERSPITPRSCR